MYELNNRYDNELALIEAAAQNSLGEALKYRVVALKDSRVKNLFLSIIDEGFIFDDIYSDNSESEVRLLFKFMPSPKPEYFRFLKREFIVAIDNRSSEVIQILKPYEIGASATGGNNNEENIASGYSLFTRVNPSVTVIRL
jgi:hypothetical protein